MWMTKLPSLKSKTNKTLKIYFYLFLIRFRTKMDVEENKNEE